MNRSIFLYGSLREPQLLAAVLGRSLDHDALEPAQAPGFAAKRIAGAPFPVLTAARGASAEGRLLRDLSQADIDRLVFYEGTIYDLMPITVETGAGQCKARYFHGDATPATGEADWDFDHWRQTDLAVAAAAAQEYMDYFGRLTAEQAVGLWPGIRIRAYQRLRARASAPHLGALRTAFAPEDVEVLRLDRAYTSFLAVQEMHLRHRRFDGGWTGLLDRSVVAWGDAVTILPYDPHRDQVLMIEQFRPAPAARGDRNPWCIEVVAGRVDATETLEQTARREAREEAGLAIGRVAAIGGYYPSPGLACEHLTAFVGEADLEGGGGLHGLPDEGEDIRALVLGFDEAVNAVAEGGVNTGPALISLLWLAANRDRLRREWVDGGSGN